MSATSQTDIPEYFLNPLEDSSSSEESGGINHEIHVQSNECKKEKYEQETLAKITKIREEVEVIELQITTMNKDELTEKFHIYEELLLQKTITLDNIDTKSIENIRENRKNTIIYIQQCLQVIDDKVNKVDQEGLQN